MGYKFNVPLAPQEGTAVDTAPKNNNGLGLNKILLVSFLITVIVLGLIHIKKHPEAPRLHDTTQSRDNSMSGLTETTLPTNGNMIQAMAVLAPMLAVLREGPHGATFPSLRLTRLPTLARQGRI